MTNEEALRLRRDLARQITAIGNDSARAQEKEGLLNVHKALSSWKDGGLQGEPPTVVARWMAGLPAETPPAASPPEVPSPPMVEVATSPPPPAPLPVPATAPSEVPNAPSQQEQRTRVVTLLTSANTAVSSKRTTEARHQLQEILSLTENAPALFKDERDQAATSLRELERQTRLNQQTSQLETLKRQLSNPTKELTALEKQIAAGVELLKNNEGDAELESLLTSARKHRATLLADIGRVTTMQATGELAAVIIEWSRMLDEGITEIDVDDAQTGLVIRMTIERVLADARLKYTAFCRSKGEEKRERARSLMPAQPAAALYEIADALTRLTSLPADMREDLDRLQREYQAAQEQYKRAADSREAALLLLSSDPAAAFAQLQAVQGIYRDLPHLAEDLARAEAAWGRQIDQQISNSVQDARRRITQAQFAEVATKIDEARALLLKLPHNYANRAALEQQISEAADSLAQQQSRAQRLAEQLAAIRQAMGQSRYDDADELLRGITAEDANQEVNSLRAAVAGARGPSDQLATAKRLLESGAVTTNYNAIADLLNKVLTGVAVPETLRSSAGQLQATLELEHAYQEGLRLLELGDGPAAQAHFTRVLTFGESGHRAEAQAQLATLKDQLKDQAVWDRWITKAAKARKDDNLRDMENILLTLKEKEAARNLSRPLCAAWDETRTIYRAAAGDRIDEIQHDIAPLERSANPEHTQQRFDQLTEAKRIVECLEELDLLDDYRLRERILLPWYRVQAQQNERLAALGTFTWETVLANWTALGKQEPLNANLQEEVKTARRRVVQRWVDQLLVNQPADALAVVERVLIEPGLENDQELLERAVKLAILAARRQMEEQEDATAVLAQGYGYARRVTGSKRSDRLKDMEQAQEVNALVQEALACDREYKYRPAVEALNNAVQDYPEYAPDLTRLRQTLAERGISRLKHETDQLERRENQNLAPLLEKYALILLLVEAAPQSNRAKNVKKDVDERMLGLQQTLESYRKNLLQVEAGLQATFSNGKKLQARTIESLRAEVDQVADDLASLRAVDGGRKDPSRDKDPAMRDLEAALQNVLKYQRTLQQLASKLEETERLLADAVRADEGNFRAATESLDDARALCRGTGQLSNLGAIIRLDTRLAAEQTYWATINQVLGAIRDALRDHPDQVGESIEQFKAAQRAGEGDEGLRPQAGDKQPVEKGDRFAKIRQWQNSPSDAPIDMISQTDQLLTIGRDWTANILAVKTWADLITGRVRALDAQWKALEEQERRPLEDQMAHCAVVLTDGNGLLVGIDTKPAAASPPAEKILDDVAKLRKRVEQIVSLAGQWGSVARPKIQRIHALKGEIPPLLNKKRYAECRPLLEEGLQWDPFDANFLAWKRTVEVAPRPKPRRGLFG